MTIPFKGYKYSGAIYKLKDLSIIRQDSGVDIVSTPSISGLGSVVLNKDRVDNFSGGIRFQKLSPINSIKIYIKWITDDWENYDFLYVRVYDDTNTKIFEKSYGNPPAKGTLTEFDWVSDTITVNVSSGYIELYLTTDESYPSKCYVDLSTEVDAIATTTYNYNAEPTSTKGETLDSLIEKFRFTKTISETLDEVEVNRLYIYNNKPYVFIKWSDGLTSSKRSVNSLTYLKSYYVPATPWLTFHYDFRRTGYKPFPYATIYVGSDDNYLYAINPDGTLRWRYNTDYPVVSSPAIGSDGTIYVGSNDYCLYAINPDGTLRWRYETNSYVVSSPAIGSDGTIYVGSDDNYFYAINPDGTLKWRYSTSGWVESSPAIGSDGTIYVGSWDYYLYAINPNGTLKWRYKTDYRIRSSPAIGSDGTIYVGSDDSYLYAINPDGTLKWRYETDFWIDSSPAIGSDGTIYVGSWDYYLYAINPNGTLKWRYRTSNYIRSSPAIGSDGTIYVGSEDHYLYAINPDGTLKWRYGTYSYVHSSPAIGSDGTIYVGSWDNYLYAINPNGTLKWRYLTDDDVESSPALA
ncbi:MAG: PQQ-binding-like beta-propeller repeat protein [Thermoproteota archaeon]